MSQTKNIFKGIMGLSLLASLGFAAFLLVSAPALAAVAPSLASESTYGVVSDTLTNTVVGSTIIGTVAQPAICYTTAPAVLPTFTGTIIVPCPGSTGTDQLAARAILLGQPCTSLGAAINLDNNPGHTTGIYTPGCYSSTGAMAITTGTTVTLSGAGVYVFRPGGALDPAANSHVVLTNGACASDVYWAPDGATTIHANASFVGNILEGAAAANDITILSTVSFEGRALAYGHTVTIDTDTITVPTCALFPPPSLGAMLLGKGFLPAAIDTGTNSTLTITFSNANASAATLTADFVDTLPPNVAINGVPSTTCGGNPPSVTATSVTLPIGAIIPGGTPGTCTVTVPVTSAVAGVYVNTAAGLVTTNGNSVLAALATLTVNALAPPGLVAPPTLGKGFDPILITVGHTSTLTITLSNPNIGGDLTLSGPLIDSLPPGVVIAAPPSPTTDCGGTANVTAIPGGDTVTLSSGATIPAAGATPGTCTVTVNVTAQSEGIFLNKLDIGALQTQSGALNNLAPAFATLTVVPLIIPPPVSTPTLNEWGMIIFMVLVGLMSIYYLRRQKAKA